MNVAQVSLRLAAVKGHSGMCISITQQFGGSLQSAAREVNLHLSNMRRFRELLVVHPTSLTTPAQDQHVHLHDGLRAAT